MNPVNLWNPHSLDHPACIEYVDPSIHTNWKYVFHAYKINSEYVSLLNVAIV